MERSTPVTSSKTTAELPEPKAAAVPEAAAFIVKASAAAVRPIVAFSVASLTFTSLPKK